MSMTARLLPVDLVDMAQAEEYFSSMAAQGLLLQRIGALAWFRRGDPQRLAYRLDAAPQGERRPSPDRCSCYEEYGWEYVCTAPPGFHLYQNSREDPVEIHTDPVAQSQTLEAMAQRMRSGSLFCLILLPIVLLMTLYAALFNGHPILYAVRYGQTAMLCMLLVDTALVWQLVQTRRRVSKLVAQLQSGIPLAHKRGYRPNRWVQLFPVVTLVLAVLSISGSLMRMLSPWEKSLAGYGGPLPTISLAQVEGVDFQAVDSGPFNRFAYQWSELAPEIYTVAQQGVVEGKNWPDGSGTYSPSLQTEVYRLRFPWLAGPLLEELAQDKMKYFRFEPTTYEELLDTSFDQAFLLHVGDAQLLFARWQGQVVSVRYHGNRELRLFVEPIFQAMTQYEKAASSR